MTQKKLVILDRDGVINADSDLYIKSPEEWLPLPGSLQAIARLNQAGFRVVVATNQSGLARNLFDVATLNQIHRKMHQVAASFGAKIDAVFFCPHSAIDACQCRKPMPGLINEILERYELKASQVIPMVGDSLRDIQAAIAGGISPWLVLTGKGQHTIQLPNLPKEAKVTANLNTFVDELLAKCEKNSI